jgi:hypothetical protein
MAWRGGGLPKFAISSAAADGHWYYTKEQLAWYLNEAERVAALWSVLASRRSTLDKRDLPPAA